VDTDPERWLTEAFRAPEGVWNPMADRIRLDVFGLGALAYYLLTGAPPAGTASALKTRLREQHGLDLAIDLPQVSSELRNVVLQATHPSPADRPANVAVVLGQLAQAERQATEEIHHEDPLEAHPGDLLDGRFRLEQRRSLRWSPWTRVGSSSTRLGLGASPRRGTRRGWTKRGGGGSAVSGGHQRVLASWPSRTRRCRCPHI
jgi:hypothetical protein